MGCPTFARIRLGCTGLALAFTLVATKAQAAVQVECGEPGSNFGTDCGLDELVAGGTITINDKIFENWSLTGPMDTTPVLVEAIDDLLNPGFTMSDTGSAWSFEDLVVSLNNLQFEVRILGDEPPDRILGRSLAAEFGSISGFNLPQQEDSNVFIKDRMSPIGVSLEVDTTVSCFASEMPPCQNTKRTASGELGFGWFAISANMDFHIISENGGSAELETFTYRVQQLPEPGQPATFLTICLGVAGLALARRRAARASMKDWTGGLGPGA